MVFTYWNSYEKPYSLLTFDPTVGVGPHIESSSTKDYVSTSAKGFLYVTDRPLILDQGYKIFDTSTKWKLHVMKMNKRVLVE